MLFCLRSAFPQRREVSWSQTPILKLIVLAALKSASFCSIFNLVFYFYPLRCLDISQL